MYFRMLVRLIFAHARPVFRCVFLLSYERLPRKPLIFKSSLSLGVHEFDALYAKVEAAYPAFEEKRLFRVDRKRRVDAGHPLKLPLKDRLLMYYRLYATSTLLGFPP